MKLVQIAAAFALSFTPLAASAQARYSPVLSTSMQRSCPGETGMTMLFDATGQSPLNQPQITRDARSFRATRDGSSYAFEQAAVSPAGDTILRANVAANGAVSNAQLSGSAFQAALAASQTPVDVSTLANSLALEIPERLIVGRTFAVGDQYYPEELRHTLVGQMTSAMGVPFPVQGSIDITYRGESTQNGRRVHVFEGALRAEGNGDMQGQVVSIRLNGPARIAYDADTGLIVEYSTNQLIELLISGQPFRRIQNHDRYNCTIVPQ
jgi:hypothetical protein